MRRPSGAVVVVASATAAAALCLSGAGAFAPIATLERRGGGVASSFCQREPLRGRQHQQEQRQHRLHQQQLHAHPASVRLRRRRSCLRAISSELLAPNDNDKDEDVEPPNTGSISSGGVSSSISSSSSSSTESGSDGITPSSLLSFSTPSLPLSHRLLPAHRPWTTERALPVFLALAAPFVIIGIILGRGHSLDWRPFAAGGLSCAFSHGVATPFDVVKTRMQTNPEMYDGSVAAAFRRIARHEGHAFLWQGLGPTVVGYALEGALKIGVYELLKPALRVHGGMSQWASFVVAGFISGIVASLVLCPAEDIRIRSVADPGYARGKSSLSAFLRLCREEGLLGAYSGFWAMNAKQVPYSISKQCSFDYLTAFAYASLGTATAGGGAAAAAKAGKATAFVALLVHSKLALAWGVPLLAAVISGVLSCYASQPGDVLLTATYKDSAHTHGAVGEVWESGGVRALFTGIKARLLHVISTVTVQLVAYDFLKRALGLGATGL